MATHFAQIRFYKQTTLRTETFTQSNFYAQILLHREVCAQINFYTQTPLHKEVFAQRNFTQKFLYTDALHKYAFTHINKGTQALLHTEPFTQRNLCTEQLLHKETFTQESFDAEKIAEQTAQRSFYRPKLLHAETLPSAVFTQKTFPHRSLYAQKSSYTAVFTQTLLPTDAFTQKKIYTQKLLHTARFYTRPAFTRRGFASPSWSPTFRVPPLKYSYQIHGAHHCQNWLMDNKTHDLVVNGPERESWGWNTLSYLR